MFDSRTNLSMEVVEEVKRPCRKGLLYNNTTERPPFGGSELWRADSCL